MHGLNLARTNIVNTARELQTRATQCQAVAALLGTLTDGAGETLPVEELAKALLPLGLCIVHQNVVRNALGIVRSSEDDEGLSGEELRVTIERLELALKGAAS